jgi:hypothetical protein
MSTVSSEINFGEILERGATDPGFYGQFFFPRAVRMTPPPFHLKLDNILEDRSSRYVDSMVFRGGAKTTKLRIYTSRRIAYGISHTILFVGKSQEHAVRSVEWIMTQVEHNSLWAQTFQLSKGKKWTASECEIIHGTDEYPIRIIALGITGSVRGINIEDYRPDLIIVDDPCDEENTATPESRAKMEALFFGALANSLAPNSEAPDAKMVLLQTPLDQDDLIAVCQRDPAWTSLNFGCFDEFGKSRWPERWSTEELLLEKESYIARGQLSLWLREMECKIVSNETAAFLEKYVQYWDMLPEGGLTYMGIDPTPPPKDGDRSKITARHDDATIVVIKLWKGKVFVCDYYATKSPDPQEFISKIFEMALIWKPFQVGVETFLFQRMLKTEIEREMQKRRQYFVLLPVEDKRKKDTRIRQAIGSRLALRELYLNRIQTELMEQLFSYPASSHDDLLDALAIALSMINPAMEGVLIGEGEYLEYNENEFPELEEWRSAP